VLGTSGQNVNDIYRVTTHEDSIEILEQNMISGHIAPTAPDTLGKYKKKGMKDKSEVVLHLHVLTLNCFFIKVAILIMSMIPLFWKSALICILLEISLSTKAKS
jgi:hypothetical protein